MFCIHCGYELTEDAVFCMECGKKVVLPINPQNSQSEHQKEMAPEQQPTRAEQIPMQETTTSAQKDIAPVITAPTNTTVETEAIIRFIPTKVFGQTMVHKASLEIQGMTYTTKFKKPIEFPVKSGVQTILCYMNYLGKSGKAETTFHFESGKKYEIEYHTPMVVMASGKLNIKQIL